MRVRNLVQQSPGMATAKVDVSSPSASTIEGDEITYVFPSGASTAVRLYLVLAVLARTEHTGGYESGSGSPTTYDRVRRLEQSVYGFTPVTLTDRVVTPTPTIGPALGLSDAEVWTDGGPGPAFQALISKGVLAHRGYGSYRIVADTSPRAALHAAAWDSVDSTKAAAFLAAYNAA